MTKEQWDKLTPEEQWQSYESLDNAYLTISADLESYQLGEL